MLTYILMLVGSLIALGIGGFLLVKSPFYPKWKSGALTAVGVIGTAASIFFIFF